MSAIAGMFIPNLPVKGSTNSTLAMNSSSVHNACADFTAHVEWHNAMKSEKKNNLIGGI